ncbi:MAG: hypothetical protein MZV70_15625 [Desulfobacterales bacterium]|nr:hypothetical protein [Desulfobacterales bacterium]
MQEIDKYNRYVETGKDLDFGRKTMVGPLGRPVPIKTAPFYGTIARKGLLITKGGLTINEQRATVECLRRSHSECLRRRRTGWRYSWRVHIIPAPIWARALFLAGLPGKMPRKKSHGHNGNKATWG